MGRVRVRRNTKRYWIIRVSRAGYEWRRVSIHLPLFREWILWEKDVRR